MVHESRLEFLHCFEIAITDLKLCPTRVWAFAGRTYRNCCLSQPQSSNPNMKKARIQTKSTIIMSPAPPNFETFPSAISQQFGSGTSIREQIASRCGVALSRSKRGSSTVWDLAGNTSLEHPQWFMVVAHVRSDVTGD